MTTNHRNEAFFPVRLVLKKNTPEQKMKLNTLMQPALTALVIVTTSIGKLTAAPLTVPDFSFEKTALADGATGGGKAEGDSSQNPSDACSHVILLS